MHITKQEINIAPSERGGCRGWTTTAISHEQIQLHVDLSLFFSIPNVDDDVA